MGLLVEFDIRDFGFIEETPQKHYDIDYTDGMLEFETIFLDTIEELCPVDTGFLKHSIQVQTSDMKCKAWTDCEYAQYVEYGTWKQRAQPYFAPALEAGLYGAIDLWSEAMTEALEEEEEEIQREMEEEAEEEEQMARSSSQGSGGGGINSILGFIGALIAVAIVEFIKQMFDFSDVRDYNKDAKGTDLGMGLIKVFMPTITTT